MPPERETILIIEDSQPIQTVIRNQILTPAGYQVLSAYDSANGMTLVHSADLVLLDINLPGMSGLDFLKTLRQKETRLPVIVMTGEISQERILQSFRLGAQDFLQKPFGEQEVLEAIDRALHTVRLQRQNHAMQRQLEQANQRLKTQVNALSNLQLIGQAITATLDETDLHRRLLDGINRLLQVEASSLFLTDEKTGELVLKISLGRNIENLEEIRLLPGQGIAGWVAQNARSTLSPDVRSDPRFYHGIDIKTGFTTRSLLAAPLMLQGEVMGVVQAINPTGNKVMFDTADLEILEALTAFVAVGLENSRLHKAARSQVTSQTLDQVAVTLNHYINNSLTVISLAAEKMQTSQPIPLPRLQQLGRAVQEEVERISAAMYSLRQSTNPEAVEYSAGSPMFDLEQGLKAWMKKKQV